MKRLICNLHDDIIKRCDKIQINTNKVRYNNDEIPSYYIDIIKDLILQIEDVNYELNEIKYITMDAKDCGQAMEYRLKDYYNTIESLGFERRK